MTSSKHLALSLKYLFSTNVKAKKLNNKLRGDPERVRGFRGATIKHLKCHVLPSFVDGTPDTAVVCGGCSDLGYKSKEALSADDMYSSTLNVMLKDIFISSLICRTNNFQNNKINTINNLLGNAWDSLEFYFINSSSLAVITWLVMGYIQIVPALTFYWKI